MVTSISSQHANGIIRQQVRAGQKRTTDRTFLTQGDHLSLKFKGGLSIIQALPKNDINLVKQAIQQGADINVKDEDGKTALFQLLRHPEPNKEIFTLLLQHGIDVNATNRYGETALHKLCRKENIDLDIFKALADRTSDLKRKNIFGDNLLHELARKTTNIEALSYILDKVDINDPDRYGRNVLHIVMAQEKPNEAALKVLLEHKADSNAKDVLGRTPIDCYKEWYPDLTETQKTLERLLQVKELPKNNSNSSRKTVNQSTNGFIRFLKKFYTTLIDGFKSLCNKIKRIFH